MEINADENSIALEKIGTFDQYIPIDYTADDYSFFIEKVSDIEYYKDTKVGSLSFSYNKHNLDTINYSRVAFNCYENVSVMSFEETLTIATSD